jgi:superkiller protein 3
MADYDLDLLHKFAKTFPESPLTDFIDDYCRWFKLPLPEPEAEADTEAGEDKAAEESQERKTIMVAKEEGSKCQREEKSKETSWKRGCFG